MRSCSVSSRVSPGLAHDDEVDACSGALELLNPQMKSWEHLRILSARGREAAGPERYKLTRHVNALRAARIGQEPRVRIRLPSGSESANYQFRSARYCNGLSRVSRRT